MIDAAQPVDRVRRAGSAIGELRYSRSGWPDRAITFRSWRSPIFWTVSENLNWHDPPYENFAAWADWRSIKANLAHIASGETHYYTKHIGYECPFDIPKHEDRLTTLLRAAGLYV